jgi:2-amino-4-hydroxy-6-hydroxymethyldihydropteridine diphosphokinase
MSEVFLGVGTNLGDRVKNMSVVTAIIERSIGDILLASSIYETEPWGFEAKDEFLNMVLKVSTGLEPAELLSRILGIEKSMGRLRGEKQYSSRIIDIDILLYGDRIIDEEDLCIPHPHLHERKFVLVPLCEIAPGLMHPVLNQSILSLLLKCSDESRVMKAQL